MKKLHQHLKRLALGAAGLFALLCTGCTAGGGTPGGTDTPAQTTAAPEVNGVLTVTVFNVGKADAIVVQTENSVTVIDAGNKGDGKTVEKFLTGQGIERIDRMIITHFDKDHVGGAARLVNRMEIGEIFVPNYEGVVTEYEEFKEKLEEKNIEATKLLFGETKEWEDDGALFKMYASNQANYGRDEENDFSIVLHVRHGEKTLLFAGDAEADRQQEILNMGLGTVNFLKYPYHGNYLPTTENFLDALQPDITVVTCTDKEYADEYTVETLKKRNIETYYTTDGTVTVVSDGKTLTATQSADTKKKN